VSVNVLQLHSSAGLYGAETVILNLSKALRQIKCTSTVGCIADAQQNKPELGKAAETLGLDVVYFPMKTKLDLLTVGKIGQVIHSRGITIIHAHGYKSNALGLIASKLYHIPIITTNHLFPPMPLDNRKLQLYSKFDVSFTMKRLDKIVAVSEEIKDKLIKKGLIESKITVIENGIDLNEYTNNEFDKCAFRRYLNIDADSFIVGTLGRLSTQKGYTFLLEAAKKILSHKTPAVFLIAGDGPLRGQLEEYAKKLNISENVKFIGFRRNTATLLKIMDVFVLSSIDEGLPMAMLEAMAARIPVLVTSVGDIPKVIENNKNGNLVEPGNSEILADKILSLLHNRPLCEQLADNAFDTVSRYYSKEAMCKKYLDIYNDLIAIK